MPPRCLLFDLDGTLVDSLPDLATALNRLRADLDLAPLTQPQVRAYVGDGATALVQRALPAGSFTMQRLSAFLDYYRQHLCAQTRPYPGIPALLAQLEGQPLAVVTNKPQQMASALLDSLNLSHYFSLVLGGDSCAEKKPHPAPLLSALHQLRAESGVGLMIGDHHTDLRAARAAGIAACFCRWGYGNDGGETPEFSAGSVAELQQLLVGT